MRAGCTAQKPTWLLCSRARAGRGKLHKTEQSTKCTNCSTKYPRVCVHRSRQHKGRPEASQLSQAKAKLSTICSLQKLPPNLLTINSQQKHELPPKFLPAISSNLNFHQNNQPPKQGLCGCWLNAIYPFSICFAVVRR